MTCIVGIEVNGKVLMGSDGCASTSYNKFEYDEPKLFIKNNILFGYTTSFRFADIIKYHVNIPAHESGVSDKEYLIGSLVTEIRNKLKDHGFTSISNNKESGGTALIGYKDKLYVLQDDFSIVRYNGGYNSCGCGIYFALGSLHTTKTMYNISPEDRVKLALEASSAHAVGVSTPFHIMWNN